MPTRIYGLTIEELGTLIATLTREGIRFTVERDPNAKGIRQWLVELTGGF